MINGQLWYIDIIPMFLYESVNFIQINTLSKLPDGITNSSKIVLFGGEKEVGALCSGNARRSFLTYSELWVFDIYSEVHDFTFLNWNMAVPRYTKIISLGGELLCVFNRNFKTQMILLDIEGLTSYPLNVIGQNSDILREGFGLAPINETTYLVYGGFNSGNERIQDLPVLTDFGIATVMETANVVKGMEIVTIQAATLSYVARKDLVQLLKKPP